MRHSGGPPPKSGMPLRLGGRRITRFSRALASRSRYRIEHSPTELPNWPAPLSGNGHTIVVESAAASESAGGWVLPWCYRRHVVCI
jgi:hypothetical protein